MQSRRGPAVFAAPLARNFRKIEVRWIPVPHIDCQARFVQDAVLAIFEPVVPPANRLVAPLDRGTRCGVVWEGVVPRTDNGLHGGFHPLQHARHAVAIAVEKAANQESRYPKGIERTHRNLPELAVTLVPQVEQEPGWAVKARCQGLLIHWEVGGPRQGARQV